MIERFERFQNELYNPFLDKIPKQETFEELPSGEFKTETAAKVLAQIPGVEVSGKDGHDIKISYKGRSKMLTGGSGGTSMTDRNAVDKVIKDLIVEMDVKTGVIDESQRNLRRDQIKNAIYR